MTTENLLKKTVNGSRIRNILLTNDDGIYAPGLAAMERALRRLGDVYVVAPSREQSGVSHSITFLTPLTVKNVFVDDKHWGWAVDGSPADCVKLGTTEILPELPDLIVSGINGGLNAGINVLYSGTVAAAIEGAFYGITSFAVSLEYNENEPFYKAADIAVNVIEEVLQKIEHDPKNEHETKKHNTGIGQLLSSENHKISGDLYNLNIPFSALSNPCPEVRIVGMDVTPEWELFEGRVDPMGRPYYWLSGRPDPRQPVKKQSEQLTDIAALAQGFITLSPLNFNLTDKIKLKKMESWKTTTWNLSSQNNSEESTLSNAPSIRTTVGVDETKNSKLRERNKNTHQ
ncbi:MAG: 5'/3'-nucleotidase SurE [Planctomycetaceae bacterium]|jgi:5'-nucleotidase|nr:5'/3'-nucleotidase SurE [Planctomycetaceae bacterium]